MTDFFALFLLSQLAGIGVTVPDPIASQWQTYLVCVQSEGFGPKRTIETDRAAFERQLAKGIEGCEALRADMEREADSILATWPEYADPQKRRQTIDQAFEGVEVQWRSFHDALSNQLKAAQ